MVYTAPTPGPVQLSTYVGWDYVSVYYTLVPFSVVFFFVLAPLIMVCLLRARVRRSPQTRLSLPSAFSSNVTLGERATEPGSAEELANNSDDIETFGTQRYRFVGLPPKTFVQSRTFRFYVWLTTGSKLRDLVAFFTETTKVVCILTLAIGANDIIYFLCSRPAELVQANLPQLSPVGSPANDMRCDDEFVNGRLSRLSLNLFCGKRRTTSTTRFCRIRTVKPKSSFSRACCSCTIICLTVHSTAPTARHTTSLVSSCTRFSRLVLLWLVSPRRRWQGWVNAPSSWLSAVVGGSKLVFRSVDVCFWRTLGTGRILVRL